MPDSLNLFEQRVLSFFDYVFHKIDVYSNNYKIEKYEFKFYENESESLGVNIAIQQKKTITRTLKITVKLNNGRVDEYKLLIPIPVDNLFVIGGNVRLNLNYLSNNQVVKVTQNVLRIDDEVIIKVIPRDNSDDVPGLYIKTEDPSGLRRYVYSKTESVDLTDRDPLIGKKLKILFNLDSIPSIIDQELVDHIISNYSLDLRDNICNKEFVTTVGMFITHLRNSTYELVSTLRSRFYKHGSIAEGYIQSVIDKFYNLRSITSVGIQTPNNINPITYNSLRNKIILSKGEDKDVAFSRINETYTDFIDMVVTPDNKNVNRINELTTAVRLTDDGAFIGCYDKNFNKIELPFIDYLVARMLTSDQVDYENKKINLGDEVTVKVGGKRMISKDGDFDYIELPSDERMSASVKMIPMINHSDSVRASMGARMLGQSIEVVGCEKPRVSSGHEKVRSDLMWSAPENGTVIAINKGVVIIRTNRYNENGEQINYSMTKPQNLESMYGINISFNTRVKVGQVVEKGDIIFSPNSIDDDNNFNFGINCRIAMMNYRGSTYEDGLVISKSMARRFAHISVTDLELVIGPDMKIEGIKLPSGSDILSSGDSLCDYQIKLDKMSKGVNKTRIEFLGDPYYYKNAVLQVPLNIKEAYLVDVKFVVGDIPSNEDETIYNIEEVLGNNTRDVKLPFEYDYAKLSLDDFKEGSDTKCSYRVKFRIVVVNHLTRGDKITNRFGSKGIVSLIEDDENLPRFEDGTPVDCVMNPAAVVSRKNISQTMELYLTNFCHHIKAKCLSMINDNNYSLDDVRDVLNKYKFTNYSSMSDEDLISVLEGDSIFQIITGTFSKITIEEIIQWYQDEKMEIGTILYDGKTGRRIRKPVITGEMYMMKLYHLADKKAQVTVDHSIRPKFVLGRGKESQSGLKTGTMETDALFANNLTKWIRYIDGNDNLKSAWFLAHCALVGLGIKRVPDDEEIERRKLIGDEDQGSEDV